MTHALRLMLSTAVLLGAFVPVLAQNTTVQFRVDMTHQIALGQFDPGAEFVDLAGSFNGWGNSPTVLDDADGDGIYEASLNLVVGSVHEYKGRINGNWDGREEFPGGGPNRTYVVVANDVLEWWYNDDLPPHVLAVAITASSTYEKPGATIRFADRSNGNPTSWTWQFPGGTPASSTAATPEVTYAAEGRYDVTLTVQNDSGDVETQTFSQFIRIDQQETFWWNDAVFYEIFVRSFQDSDGDGRGDFRGLIDRLDYLNDGDPTTTDDLGVTGIWLMPVQQSPSYHGYDATDYRTIENDYGTNQDFLDFMDAAHERGIRVIVDLVMNHSSSQHPWFLESVNPNSDKRDWYVWEDSNPGDIGPWGQTVWHQRNNDFFYGVFWSGMPDLNYATQEVQDEMFDIARFWLEDLNVDGFRLDAVKFIHENGSELEDTDATIQFWKDFRTHYKSVAPESFSVGEAWTSTAKAQRYVNDGGLDYCFEFDLAGAMLNAVNAGNTDGLGSKMDEVMSAYPYLQFGTFLTNHDMDRVMNVLAEDETKARLAANLLLTLPGIPYLYYGEEIGMTGAKPDPDIRTPMHWDNSTHAGFTSGSPWRPVNGDFPTKNIAAQQADSTSLWHTYRTLIAIRNSQKALRQGNYQPVESAADPVFAFLRYTDQERVMVAANLEDSVQQDAALTLEFSGLPAGEYYLEELSTGAQFGLSVNSQGGFSGVDIGTLAPRSTKIFSLRPGPLSAAAASSAALKVTLFPNPANAQVNLRLAGATAGQVDYAVLNALGQAVSTGSLQQRQRDQTHVLNLQHLNPGFYVIRLNPEGQEPQSVRLVLQR